MKICNRCKIQKEIIEFYKNKRSSDGYRHTCKCCEIESAKEWQRLNPNQRANNNKKWRNINFDYHKNYYKNLSDDKKDENYKKYYLQHDKRNDQKEKERRKLYKISYREKYNKLRREKINSDPILKIFRNFRNFIHNSFKKKGIVKLMRSYEILGCSFEEFKLHLESKFEPWMNWDNYGKYNGFINYGWDLDHIIPISSAKKEEDIVKLNHYTNFQPLCSYVNRHVKFNKLDYQFE